LAGDGLPVKGGKVKKTGIEKIKVRPGKGADRFCASCRRLARNRVTFENGCEKLNVRLCNTCAGKEYDDLLLQNRFPWPGVKMFDRLGKKG